MNKEKCTYSRCTTRNLTLLLFHTKLSSPSLTMISCSYLTAESEQKQTVLFGMTGSRLGTLHADFL